MATVLTKSLRERFAELQAERAKSWAPAQLAANAGQRAKLAQRFDPASIAQIGDKLPATKLANVEGGSISVRDLTANGPAVFVFFRFAGCPACNIALKYYEETLWPALREKGVPLVALSPQRPDLLRAIKERHPLTFTVATDPESGLADYLGISFVPDDRPSPPPAGWIGEVTGTDSWVLPQPTVAIVDRDQRIRWLHVSPDWLDRPEAEEILAAVNALD
jgi:peroxiredoxin